MTTQTFEVYGSMKNHKGTDAFLLSKITVALSYRELLEAVALSNHKMGITTDKCLGYKVSDDGIAFYFEK